VGAGGRSILFLRAESLGYNRFAFQGEYQRGVSMRSPSRIELKVEYGLTRPRQDRLEHLEPLHPPFPPDRPPTDLFHRDRIYVPEKSTIVQEDDPAGDDQAVREVKPLMIEFGDLESRTGWV
jgi:hypothetical protein